MPGIELDDGMKLGISTWCRTTVLVSPDGGVSYSRIAGLGLGSVGGR